MPEASKVNSEVVKGEWPPTLGHLTIQTSGYVR